MSPKTLFSLSLVLALSAPVSAQVVDPAVRRGPLAGVSSLLTLESSQLGSPIYFKSRGDQSQPPAAWPSTQTSTVGNYALDVLFPEHHQWVEIDAMSSGNALIPTDDGVVQNDSLWSAVTISVANGAVGTPNDGWITNRATPGADLATHYLPGSQGLHSSLVGETFITQHSGHMGLPGGEDIKSLDVALGVLEEASGIESRLFFLFRGVFYFSLSPTSATNTNLNSFVLDKAGDEFVRPDPAAIYRMVWYNDTRTWSKPREFLAPSDLGLAAGSDNVDAIDVSPPLSGSVYHMVFSTQPKFGVSQLQVYEENEDGSSGVFPLLSDDGLVASDGFYLDPGTTGGLDNGDDVDAVCFFDPEVGQYDNLVGTAVEGEASLGTPGLAGVPLGLCTLWEGRNAYYFHVSGRVVSPTPGGLPGPSQVRHVVIEYSTDLDLTNPSAAQWNELESGDYTGRKAELHGVLPIGVGLGLNDELFFRARVYNNSTKTALLRSSWISALVY